MIRPIVLASFAFALPSLVGCGGSSPTVRDAYDYACRAGRTICQATEAACPSAEPDSSR